MSCGLGLEEGMERDRQFALLENLHEKNGQGHARAGSRTCRRVSGRVVRAGSAWWRLGQLCDVIITVMIPQ